jgi:hypothetical protein
MYLNLGFLGLFLQLALIVSCYRKARRQMLARPVADDSARLRRALAYYKLAFLLGLVLFNLTDATFKALHPSFFVFFLVSIDWPPARSLPARIWRHERPPDWSTLEDEAPRRIATITGRRRLKRADSGERLPA